MKSPKAKKENLASEPSPQDVKGYGWELVENWFTKQGWKPFEFQEDCWKAYLAGKSGLLNAPTGSGKTLALFLPPLIEFINEKGKDYAKSTNNGLQLLWITPLRALTADIRRAMANAAWDMGVSWLIKAKTGDTSSVERKLIKEVGPEVLLTTPESLHLMLAGKDAQEVFKTLKCVVVDEWHELMGSKRGVQVELALASLKNQVPNLRIWGISATIGNLDQASDVLIGLGTEGDRVLVKSSIKKKINTVSIFPDEVEHFPWAGHLGLKLLPKMLPILQASTSSLVFINTRAQSELWYRALVEAWPEVAGSIAIHHGSLDMELRTWVETALHEGKLKVVVCTSSLDLGVDFAPVDTVMQVGSPKVVARYIQRAGRSGHRPGAVSTVYFVPTHTLELLEAAALKDAVQFGKIEDRPPLQCSFDVLLQYLVTLATGGGFDPKVVLPMVRGTYAFKDITDEQWAWCLQFITTGGASLAQYPEYSKVGIDKTGTYRIKDKSVALRHILSIGTIVSEPSVRIQYQGGVMIGTVEEGFIARLKPGNSFWFGGRSLKLVRVKDLTAIVTKSNIMSGNVPSYMGGRMTLSGTLSASLLSKLSDYVKGVIVDKEILEVAPVLELQKALSAIPTAETLLIEKIESSEGHHLFFYPFAGRYVHQGLGSLLAWRLAQSVPVTFSIAMNDYGLELLSEDPIDLQYALDNKLLSPENLHEDLLKSLNSTEMAKRKFRDIAQIAGLIFTGYPGHSKRQRHLQASSSLLFDVIGQYDPSNLLLAQAHREVYEMGLDEGRLISSLEAIAKKTVVVTNPKKPTPFAFPIMVDRMRERVTSEKLEDRIKKMRLDLDLDSDIKA